MIIYTKLQMYSSNYTVYAGYTLFIDGGSKS